MSPSPHVGVNSRGQVPMMRRATLLLAVLAVSSQWLSGCRSRESKPDVARLVAELGDEDPRKSGAARLQLVSLGEPAVPALVERLRGGSAVERTTAANVLWGLGSRAHQAAPALAETLADPDPDLRVASAMALEAI